MSVGIPSGSTAPGRSCARRAVAARAIVVTALPTGPERPWTLSLLPPFPPVAASILSLTSARDVDSGDLAAMIRRDASFTAELLRVANSALFGFSRRVGTVAHAVVLLGLDRVKAMAMFVALRSPLRAALKSGTLKAVWTHTLATAMIAERMANANGSPAEETYTAGLLHNLGAMGLMCAYPADYALLLELPPDGAQALLDAERALFGVDHCQAGQCLAREWKLPESIAIVAGTHHEEPVAGDVTVVNTVRAALRVAGVLGFNAGSESCRGAGYQELLASAGCARFDTAEYLERVIRAQLVFVPSGE